MQSAELNGVSITYQEAGDGYPIIFCHEFAGSMESWKLQLSYFSRRYRAITYNARGYPPSEVPPAWEVYSQDHQVATLHALLDHLGIEDAFICGLSMGAHVALSYGLAHPDRCRGLIAAGAGTGSSDAEVFKRESEARAEALEKGGMASQERYLTGATRVRFKHKDPEGWREFAAQFRSHSALGSANTLRGFQARRPTLYSRQEELASLRLPVLVVVGDDDEPCLEPSLFLKRIIPRSGLVVMPQTGHACNLEEPALFNHVVSEFCTQVEAGQWQARPTGSGDDWSVTRP